MCSLYLLSSLLPCLSWQLLRLLTIKHLLGYSGTSVKEARQDKGGRGICGLPENYLSYLPAEQHPKPQQLFLLYTCYYSVLSYCLLTDLKSLEFDKSDMVLVIFIELFQEVRFGKYTLTFT